MPLVAFLAGMLVGGFIFWWILLPISPLSEKAHRKAGRCVSITHTEGSQSIAPIVTGFWDSSDVGGIDSDPSNVTKPVSTQSAIVASASRHTT